MTPPSVPVSARYRSRRQVSSARQGDTTVLLDIERGRYYTLNEVGGRIWSLLAQGGSATEIAALLASEYDVARDQLLADVTVLLDELSRTKLVEVTDA